MSLASPVRGQVDLIEQINWQSVECLNEKPSSTYVNALKQGYREDEGLMLESDDDEQLLLYFAFNQMVKLHSIVVKAPNDGSGPKTLKLFANREHMGFSNVTDFPASQDIILSPEQLEGKPVPLKFVKFQNVRSLTMFVESNQGETEVTKIQKLAVLGTTVETTNMNELKKVEHEH
eukprot:TRINITY_DN14271_c0_g1_i1.p1 TRINITY_DN14271_c0_g1~~TRINITY_DN14271_c0_g1_i1.p1  ORF type:complete len:176 (+),score=48.15 TRINITY_DN14271_c0_g1_i1:118-645(+)